MTSTDYLFVLLLGFLGVAFPAGTLFLSWLLGRLRVRVDNPTPVKSAPYECGMEPVGDAWIRFNFRYYLYALVFVIFDIETIFLYPWAVQLRQLKLLGFIEMAIFVVILLIGFVYAWRKRALQWT